MIIQQLKALSSVKGGSEFLLSRGFYTRIKAWGNIMNANFYLHKFSNAVRSTRLLCKYVLTLKKNFWFVLQGKGKIGFSLESNENVDLNMHLVLYYYDLLFSITKLTMLSLYKIKRYLFDLFILWFISLTNLITVSPYHENWEYWQFSEKKLQLS